MSRLARFTINQLSGALEPSNKPALERAFDSLLALSLGSWAILGWAATEGPVTLPRIAVSTLHLSVALAITRRAPVVRIGSPRAVMAALPALVVAGLAFRLAAPLAEWPVSIQGLFFLGACIAVTTFLALGDNFAVLPALRGVVSRGPYAYVRHPAYAGELGMMLACLLSIPSPMALAVLLTALPLIGLRILTEERLLSEVETYRDYAEQVPYRLVPGMW